MCVVKACVCVSPLNTHSEAIQAALLIHLFPLWLFLCVLYITSSTGGNTIPKESLLL